jgi:predicted nucleic acid-binding protein
MRVADTSALVGLFVATDEHHEAALRAFEDPTPVVVPAEILAEAMLLLARRFGPTKARAAGDALWALDNIEVQPSGTGVLMAAWGELAANRKLTFPDCIVVAWCREEGAAPLAFDRDLLRAAKA